MWQLAQTIFVNQYQSLCSTSPGPLWTPIHHTYLNIIPSDVMLQEATLRSQLSYCRKYSQDTYPAISQNIHVLHLPSTDTYCRQASVTLRFPPGMNDTLPARGIQKKLPRHFINWCTSSYSLWYPRQPRGTPARLPCAATLIPPAHPLQSFIPKS